MFRIHRSIRSIVRPNRRLFNNNYFFSTTPFVYQPASSSSDDDKDDNEFIASLIANKNWLSSKLELPTVEDISAKLNQLYPEFTSQFTHLHDNYQKLWDYLAMEDFRHIVDEVMKEQSDPTLHPEITREASVREGSTLSHEELTFIKARQEKQVEAFAKFVGIDSSQVDDVRDVPVVGLASSGGGYRAMLGLAGYLGAMQRSGMLDCLMYMTGVSGSCWTMALYYHPWMQADPARLVRHLQSRVGTHWANMAQVLRSLSPDTSKALLQGVVQRYHQQHGDISLVDIFGMLIGNTLLPPVEETTVHLTSQANLKEEAALPLPIYCVVRHDIALVGKSLEDRLKALKEKYGQEVEDENVMEKIKDEETEKDGYQWFEFTPYEMGCDELETWVPMWSFGRKFEKGHAIEKLVPEQSLDILMGMFGSAFAASLVHFYQEIKSFLPTGSLDKVDDVIKRYEASMSSYHPISPSSFPNPFYQLASTFKTSDGQVVERPAGVVDSEELYLMDAGMDNNIPFYPLLRKDRHVDIVLAVDLSADIQTTTHFDRAESYIKRRGIEGWPVGAGWPKKQQTTEDDNTYPLGSCTVFDSHATVTTDGQEKQGRPITLVYFPFIINTSFDPEFDPQTEEFCRTWNFVYTPDQVEKVVGLAQANWDENIDKIKTLLKKTWERKRQERLAKEKKREMK